MKSIEEKINYYKESLDLFDDGMDKYKFLILHFINEHYVMKLNIKDLIDNSDNIWISYYLISFDGDIHKSEEILVTMDENGLSRIFVD